MEQSEKSHSQNEGIQPVIGIVADPQAPHGAGAPYGKLSTYFRDFVEHAQARGWTAYVFSPKDVLKQRQVIWGWTRSNGSWQREFFQLPHIVYLKTDHLSEHGTRVLDWLHKVQFTQFLNQVAVEQIVMDRWRMLQVCLSHPILGSRIPDSSLLRSTSPVSDLFSSTNELVLFPRFRRVKNQPAGLLQKQGEEWVLRIEHNRRAETRSIRSSLKLRSELELIFGEVVVQRYIRPLRVEKCPVSIRSAWLRGRDSRWREVFVAARVGRDGSFGSNYATASLLDRFLPLLSQAIPRNVQAILFDVRRISQQIAELIDQRAHGAGELAIDFSITQEGTVYIQNITTLGGASSLLALTQPDLKHTYITTLLNYCANLYEQTFQRVSEQASTAQIASVSQT